MVRFLAHHVAYRNSFLHVPVAQHGVHSGLLA